MTPSSGPTGPTNRSWPRTRATRWKSCAWRSGGSPDYYELVVVTSEKILKDDPDVVERFVRALRRGYLDAAADTQKAVDTLLAGTREEVDEAIERPGVDLVAPMWSAGTAAFGWQDQQRWMVFTQWMQDNGLLAQSVDHADAFTNSFVEKVAR